METNNFVNKKNNGNITKLFMVKSSLNVLNNQSVEYPVLS